MPAGSEENGPRRMIAKAENGRPKLPKPVGGLDRCLLIRFLRVISVVEHRRPTESVEAEIQPSDGFPYRRTESRIVPHLLSWHSGKRPLFELSCFSSTAAAARLSDPSSHVGAEKFLPRVSITRKTPTSRPPSIFIFLFRASEAYRPLAPGYT